MSIFALPGKEPVLGNGSWLAPGSAVIGKATLADNVSVWWNAIVRADSNAINIGEYSTVQDAAILYAREGMPLNIGRYVTIGQRSILHSCTIGDEVLIGVGVTILSRAVVGQNSIIVAGTMIMEDQCFPEGMLISGIPGKAIRQLTHEEIDSIAGSARRHYENARTHSISSSIG